MDDPVLMSRLAAIRNNFNVVSANLGSKAWQPGNAQSATRAELVGESSLWAGLEATLITEIRKFQKQVTDVESMLDEAAPGDRVKASAAWVRYSKILTDSQGLLRECVEIIGTLAIRQKDLDHRTLFVADELIRDCLTLSTGGLDYYLLVHGLGDALSKTRARIIRLRFPEWTIWDLPLASHELGNVVIGGILVKEQPDDPSLRVLTPFLGMQRDALLPIDADLNKKCLAGGDAAVEASRWAEGRVRTLLADAFATYTMGPAYAYSAISLRLSPTAVAQGEKPADGQRAQVILSMLDWMNGNSGSVSKPYTDDILRLTQIWDDAVDRGNPNSMLNAKDKDYLAQLAQTFGSDVSDACLNRTAMYPALARNEGWTRAKEWADDWLTQWRAGNANLAPPDNQIGKLRDVLNATWLCRVCIQGKPNDINRAHLAIANAGQELCISIITTPKERRQITPSAATAQGGGL